VSEYPIGGRMSSRPPLPAARARPIAGVMTSGEHGKGGVRPADRKGNGARAERLRTALRENLKRRKSQARGRSQPEDRGAPHDSAGFVAEIAPDKPKG
jgi:hypothetical protein